MAKPLYVFDMDETLINGDCAMIWNEFLLEKGVVQDPSFLAEDQRLMELYSQGKLDMDEYLEFAMAPLLHLSKKDVDALVDECVETHILSRQFDESKTLIQQLEADGIDMLIISATVTFVVEAVAKRIGIKHSLGIDLAEKNDRYTAKIEGVPSYREGKVTRLEQWLSQSKQPYAAIHFYTDSINDLALCEHADYAYLINPCPSLAALPKQDNWTTLSWN
ncbi:HAD family hydrolase [Vibrio breoganii]|uniref:HAD family hydrolase n=1 Tax=Vibrio breoganii TaxID=553239 RepID=UPI000C834A5A|nr:HAD family hydrolase [Vibrio breoganii]PMG95297.1 HAD family hydrolase [Vibrio breoganii]PMJ49811.1 HAD family hydrolase [Vibrio breoganii]PMK54752.1 HAD family hydrolase [Vibrio breoganii]PMO27601.1 HAD family hydrolase [Vibrio breoganii]PMO35107.1 HAD family hydrolase [Vibrio breoganii]